MSKTFRAAQGFAHHISLINTQLQPTELNNSGQLKIELPLIVFRFQSLGLSFQDP